MHMVPQHVRAKKQWTWYECDSATVAKQYMKKKKKRKNTTAHKDLFSVQKSREHGRATKYGIKKAKNIKRTVLKAVSKSKGKTKAEIASALFTPGTTEMPDVPASKCNTADSKRKHATKQTTASSVSHAHWQEM